MKAQLAATAAGLAAGAVPAGARWRPTAGRCAAPTSRAGRRGRRAPASCISTGPTPAGASTSATGERAGPVDLIYHATGLTDGALFEEAARLARMDRPVPPRPARPKPDHTLEVRRILDGCRPLAGSPAETYLRSRGLSDPALAGPALPSRPHRLRRRRAAGRAWSPSRAMADGAPVGGIHRTFLLDDGSAQGAGGQEDAGLGGGRRGAAVPDRRRRSSRHRRGHRDRALRAARSSGSRSGPRSPPTAWRAGSGRPTCRRVTIFADAGDAGRQAAARLADRLNLADIPNEIVAPLHGDDFNDDLQRGAVAADYATRAGRGRRREATPAPVAGEPSAAHALRRAGSRGRGADQSARRHRARHAARPSRARPARPAARAPGAGADQEPRPASPCRCSTSRSPSCAGG